MIAENKRLPSISIGCPECGKPNVNILPPSSAFIRLVCDNNECDARGVVVTIEKCSNIVFSVYPPFIIDGKYAWPKVSEFTDVDGKVIWPLPDPPSQTHNDR
jgi:hypothetical protein